MQRTFLMMLGLTIAAAVAAGEAHGQGPRGNQGLPKVDYQIGAIYKLGQGLAIPVKNGGFEMSPNTTVAVRVFDAQSRQLLTAKNLSLPPMFSNQSRRVIFVPPNTGRAIMVQATVDPGNRVAETNERNNTIASRH